MKLVKLHISQQPLMVVAVDDENCGGKIGGGDDGSGGVFRCVCIVLFSEENTRFKG